MRTAKFKQVACVSESNAAAFETKANLILAQSSDSEVVMDRTLPFTAYIFFNVRKDQPETVLELLEMLDGDGGHAVCEDCPAFIKSKDKRTKWGKCKRKPQPTRCDSRACELYYLERRREAQAITEELNQIPFTIE